MSIFRQCWSKYFSGASYGTTVKVQKETDFAIWKVRKLLASKDESLRDICLQVEIASSRAEVKTAFNKFNKLMSFFQRAASDMEHYRVVRGALNDLGTSDKFSESMKTSFSLGDAIVKWKIDILQSLSDVIRWRNKEECRVGKMDDELISRYLTESSTTAVKPERSVNKKTKVQKSSKRRKLSSSSFETAVEPESSVNKKTKVQRSSKRRKLSSSSFETTFGSSDIDSLRHRGICIFFQFGRCKRGAYCNYKHIIDHNL